MRSLNLIIIIINFETIPLLAVMIFSSTDASLDSRLTSTPETAGSNFPLMKSASKAPKTIGEAHPDEASKFAKPCHSLG